jgi:hypothetical protein
METEVDLSKNESAELVGSPPRHQLNQSIVSDSLARQCRAAAGMNRSIVSDSLARQLRAAAGMNRSIVSDSLARQLRAAAGISRYAHPWMTAATGETHAAFPMASDAASEYVDLRLLPWLWELTPLQRRKLSLDCLVLLLTIGGVFHAMDFGFTARFIALTLFVVQLCRISILVDELLEPEQ